MQSAGAAGAQAVVPTMTTTTTMSMMMMIVVMILVLASTRRRMWFRPGTRQRSAQRRARHSSRIRYESQVSTARSTARLLALAEESRDVLQRLLADKRFRQIIGAYYDYDVAANHALWQTAMQGVRGITGGMYTTWRRNYDSIEAFGDLHELTEDCPRGCTHGADEPECGLDEAVAAGEAVEAAPPSRSYRLRKFVRRNRWQVGAAALLLLSLIAIATLVITVAAASWSAGFCSIGREGSHCR